MKKTIIISGLILICTLFSCKVDKNCPAFDPSDLSNISYKMLDTLKFTDQQEAVFNIYIQTINQSAAFDQECVDLHKICPCLNYVDVLATNSNSADSYVFLKMEQSDVSDMQYFKYQVMDFYFEIDFT